VYDESTIQRLISVVDLQRYGILSSNYTSSLQTLE